MNLQLFGISPPKVLSLLKFQQPLVNHEQQILKCTIIVVLIVLQGFSEGGGDELIR